MPIVPLSREPRDPTRAQSLVFWAKIQGNRARRAVQDLRKPVQELERGDPSDYSVVVAESRTPLWSETDPRERRLQLGKVQNLRLAVRHIDRCKLVEGQQFSFWSQVGMPSTGKGYVPGRQIQEGCVVPAIGGGICQLSNALYDVALRAGFEVTERHAHTRALPNAPWSAGRDATVAWNHIDLRFRSPYKSMLRARLSQDELVVQVLAMREVAPQHQQSNGKLQTECESCETCGMSQCWRHRSISHTTTGTTTAWLVDQVWPEFADYLRSQKCDALYLPLKRKDRYAWPIESARHMFDAKWIALCRSRATRRLAEQGAERQLAAMRFDSELAWHYSQRLSFDATHLVVAQTLLPFLWHSGALGGRTFDVLMTRRPMESIHRILDAESERHPERKLLSDFRAPEEGVSAEQDALAAASRIVTPHSEIAAMFPEKAVLLPWQMPPGSHTAQGRTVVFAGPTVARKGAYELREAMRTINAPLRFCGSMLEGADFWQGLDASPATGDWLEGTAVVVQPALLEDQPRKLLRAIACGVPVIATPACGVTHLPGVTTVPAGDSAALRNALSSALP